MSLKNSFIRATTAAGVLSAVLLAASPAEASPRVGPFFQEMQLRINQHNFHSVLLTHRMMVQLGYSGQASRSDIARSIIEFVQSLNYVDESDDPLIPPQCLNRCDWWQFPDETLAKGGGDCEDLSILAYTMLRAAGVPAFVVQFPTHVALAVQVPDASGGYFNVAGQAYFFVELTAPVPIGYGFPQGTPFRLYRP